jgi:hypothetical protein
MSTTMVSKSALALAHTPELDPRSRGNFSTRPDQNAVRLQCVIAADHGGSLGALTVVSGSLSETRWDGEGLLRRQLEAVD